MPSPRHALSVLLAGGALAAQSFTVLPNPTYATADGNTFLSTLFAFPNARFQQVDGSLRTGLPLVDIDQIAWRRDATFAAATATARTATVEVRVGQGNRATFGRDFDANYANAPTVVFTARPVNLPSWATLPPTNPAPFDVVLAFDQKVTYSGLTDLIYEVRVSNGSVASFTSYPQDMATPSYTSAIGAIVGTGCLNAPSTTLRMGHNTLFEVSQTFVSFGFNTYDAPPSAPITLLLGTSDPNLTLAGVCGPLRSNATLILPLASTDATGFMDYQRLEVPFLGSLLGLRLFTQTLAPNAQQAGIQATLSNGRNTAVPATQGGPWIPALYTYNTSSATAATGSTPTRGGYVTRLRN